MLRLVTTICLLTIFFGTYAQTKDAGIEFVINGLSNPLLENVSVALKPLTTSQQPDIKKIAAQGQQKIKQALQPYGYFSPTIGYSLQTGKIIYQINPGNPILIQTVHISLSGEGEKDPELLEAVDTLFYSSADIKIGKPFNSAAYEKAKKALFNQAEHSGFLTAQYLRSEVLINVATKQAEIYLSLATGPRYYFGETHFAGSKLNNEFLRRFIPFKSGEPYDSNFILELEQRLNSSGYFSQVQVTGEQNEAVGRQVPIQVALTPVANRHYRIGLGFGTDTGPRATLGIDWRRINQYGHRFNSTLKVSTIQANLQARYEIPGQNPLTDRYVISANSKVESIAKGDSTTQAFGVASIKRIWGLDQTLSLTYQIDRFRKDKDTPYRTTKLLVPSANWTKTEVDNVLDPTSGYQAKFTVRGATKTLLSEVNFLQFIGEGDYFYPVSDWGRLRAKGRLGYTLVSEREKLPLSLSFYTGGAERLRGYPYQSIGPARYLTELSIQYQHRVYDKVYIGPFFDIGNASNQRFGEKLQQGVGVVLTWTSPVGPLNLSLGQAITKPGKPLLLQFSMGSGL